ncbi:hypothetical protein L2E82_29797 [Cichorium intybus]|uniref:Uncharacterized protein n=1 Tax=Cichorium intybus TaxID=13427 RepID=A0ACB9CYX9_CICIN|nr:hypothetical protein L2E82_29797 [Cichorium intybus]
MEDKEIASDRIQHRNIMDMRRDDQASGSKKNWKAFRAGKAWTSTVPPASDLPINTNTNHMMIRRALWTSWYPKFIDALRDLDDGLTMVHLFAALPVIERENIQAKRIQNRRGLSIEW